MCSFWKSSYSSESEKWNSYFPSTSLVPTLVYGPPFIQMSPSEDWKKSLNCHGRHSFPSSLPISYPLSIVSTNTAYLFSQCPSLLMASQSGPYLKSSSVPASYWCPGFLPASCSILASASCLPACRSCLFLHPSSLTTLFLFDSFIFACAMPSFWNAFLLSRPSFKTQLSYPQS